MSEIDDPKTTTAEVREFYSYGCGPRPTWEESQAEFDVWLAAHDAEVERAAAEKAVQNIRNEIRGIPHWWNTEEQRGGFDIPPLGPNTSSEEGAFMEVMRVLDECAAAYRREGTE